MYRVLGHPPSLGTFRRFYCNSYSNGWLSFSKRGSGPCCVSKPLDSLKNWNDRFFWIDASICPIFVPWYNEASVRKDPLPSDDVLDLDLLDKLDKNRTLIRKYTETFLCLVGLSRSFDDPAARPTLFNCDNSDMGLLDFVKSADPFKVKTRERTLTKGEVLLLTETADMVVAPSAQTVRLVNHTIPVLTITGKSPVVIQRLIDQGKQVDGGSGSAAPGAEEFVSSFVTLTPDHEDHEASGSTHDRNIRTHRASESYVVEVENVTAKPIDRAMGASVLGNRVDFLDLVNANYAQHIWMMSELHLRYEHKIMVKERFERKFTHRSVVVQQKDAKIAILKYKLGKAESKVAAAVGLRKRVSNLKVMAAASQVAKLETDCEILRGAIAGEAKLREKFSSIQDAATKRFDERSAELDARMA
ncbi:hypothetical protein Tco_0725326 [Tanacetum coccineum]|uniref:Transposase (Putative), gypsy type n=1 Tax=Tanacetum coccineum TaxID=301880 RepID=A0ABQ4YES8_9ASTR